MVEAPQTEADVMRRGTAALGDRLPTGWSARPSPGGDWRVGGTIDLTSPDGRSVTLIVEAKRLVEGRDVAPLKERLTEIARMLPGAEPLVIARYLSPPVRAKLADAGLSYIDVTGNMRVAVSSPGLYLSDRGADSDPWRGPGRPRGTLKGEPAAKVIRAITDISGPWAIRRLVDTSKASTGATYRVVEYLEREGLATRNKDGLVNVAEWEPLLRRWSDDYGFTRTNQVSRWIAPRGLPDLLGRIASATEELRYAVTGSIAAAEWAPYAPARLAMVYVADAESAAKLWDLRLTDAGANVTLAEPQFDVVFERTRRNRERIEIAAPTQVVVDLLTGPGRNPSEAEELIEWMKRNEQSWR